MYVLFTLPLAADHATQSRGRFSTEKTTVAKLWVTLAQNTRNIGAKAAFIKHPATRKIQLHALTAAASPAADASRATGRTHALRRRKSMFLSLKGKTKLNNGKRLAPRKKRTQNLIVSQKQILRPGCLAL